MESAIQWVADLIVAALGTPLAADMGVAQVLTAEQVDGEADVVVNGYGGDRYRIHIELVADDEPQAPLGRHSASTWVPARPEGGA